MNPNDTLKRRHSEHPHYRAAPAYSNLQGSDRQVYETVCLLHNDGCHLIPTGGGDDSKTPIIPRWKEYQHRQPTSVELNQWQQKYHPALWANVCGAASGRIVVDADSRECQRKLEANGLKPHVLTPKGAHFYIEHPGYHVKPIVRVVPDIDIRGDGSYANVTHNQAREAND